MLVFFLVQEDGLLNDLKLGHLQLLLFAGLAFFLLLPQMKRTLTISIDIDWFYRVVALRIARLIGDDLKLLMEGIKGGTPEQINTLIAHVRRYHGPSGILARTLPTGRTVFWVAVIFAGYLILTLAT